MAILLTIVKTSSTKYVSYKNKTLSATVKNFNLVTTIKE